MKTVDLLDDSGRVVAFEISVLETDRRGICRVVESIPGAKLIRSPKRFSWSKEDVFCEFEVDGEKFIALEPFGDNSRYWIGPDTARHLSQTQRVRDAFDAVRASRLFRSLGILVGTVCCVGGVLIFALALSGSSIIPAISSIILGGYFIYFGLTGRPLTWSRRSDS